MNELDQSIKAARSINARSRWREGGNEDVATDGLIIRSAKEHLEQAEKEPPIKLLCGSLVTTGEGHILGGDDRAGKSKFMWNLSRSIVLREQFMSDCTLEDVNMRIGIFDLELKPAHYKQRFKKQIEQEDLQNLKIINRDWGNRKAWTKGDHAEAIVDKIGNAVMRHGLHLMIVDNTTAVLGDISDNKEYRHYWEGLRYLQHEVTEGGGHFGYVNIGHLTKEAQGRRRKNRGGQEGYSLPQDIRGAGIAQSFAGSVMEIRPSSNVPNVSCLHHWNARNGALAIDPYTQCYAFDTSHAIGDFSYHYRGIETNAQHFGDGASHMHDEDQHTKFWDSHMLKLHSKGFSNNQIAKELKTLNHNTTPRGYSKDGIARKLKGHGRNANGTSIRG